jgi:hypothetical protein
MKFSAVNNSEFWAEYVKPGFHMQRFLVLQSCFMIFVLSLFVSLCVRAYAPALPLFYALKAESASFFNFLMYGAGVESNLI